MKVTDRPELLQLSSGHRQPGHRLCGRRQCGRPPVLAATARHQSSCRGFVLIVVLVLVVMISFAGFGFLAAMSTEYAATKISGDQLQSQQTLASAETVVIWLMGLPSSQREALGGYRSNTKLFRGNIVQQAPTEPGQDSLQNESLMPEGEPDVRWRYAVVSTEQSAEQGTVLRFGLRNESARLNLSSVLKWDQQSADAGRRALMQLPNMTPEIADAILDWIDADDQVREFGAESEYYAQLDQPYAPANALPATLEELLFVKGVTKSNLLGHSNFDPGQSSGSPETVFPSGDLTTTSSSGDSSQLSGDSSVSSPVSAGGWKAYLTLHSAERNLSSSGQPRVFLNGDSLATLEQQLAEFLPPEMVRFILLARVYGILPATASSTSEVPGSDPQTAPYNSAMTPAFSIPSVESLLNGVIQVSTAAGVQRIGSPLRDDGPEFATLLNTLLDRCSVSNAASINGRININEADERVLRAIPGMSTELVSQIVSQRDTLDSADRQSTAWLLSKKLTDAMVYRQLATEITSGGDVVSGEIIVFRAIGGPVLRREVTVDGAGKNVRRLDWHDLSDAASPWPAQLLIPPQR